MLQGDNKAVAGERGGEQGDDGASGVDERGGDKGTREPPHPQVGVQEDHH